MDITAPEDEDLERFWVTARKSAGLARLGAVVGENPAALLVPPAWSFGQDAETADALLKLVLARKKTATSSALWEWEAEGEDLPEAGALAIVCDGAGRPRALLRTEAVDVVPFDAVPAEHVAAEGEGDVERWRSDHEAYFAAALAPYGRDVAAGMPVVLERFTLIHPRR